MQPEEFRQITKSTTAYKCQQELLIDCKLLEPKIQWCVIKKNTPMYNLVCYTPVRAEYKEYSGHQKRKEK